MENTAGPTIFKNPNFSGPPSQNPKTTKGWSRGKLIKIAIVVLVVAVLAEVLFSGLSLFSPEKMRSLNILQPKINDLGNAHLSLVSKQAAFKKTETVVIEVKLYTGGYTTDSTDLVVKYDPTFLKPQGENFAQVGQIYSEYPAVQVDEKNGLIGISGITIPGSASFSGVGTFAKLNFTALKEGQTQLLIDYQPDKTSDSNVVLSGSSKDILGVVTNADINITDSATTEQASTNSQNCESFTQYCQDAAGKAGSQVCKAGTIKDGSCRYDPKLTVSCEECKTQ